MFSVIVFLPQLSFDSQGYKVLSISCSDKELSQLKKRERERATCSAAFASPIMFQRLHTHSTVQPYRWWWAAGRVKAAFSSAPFLSFVLHCSCLF
jgi:hypothetical protein